ncbi:MAG: hypothetical protein ACXVY6_04085 [Gaiellaceae bacterium]
MKRLISLAVIIVAALSITAAAFAGNGSTTTPFKASYSYGPGITAVCSGSHIVKTAFTKDSETCVLTPEFFFTPGIYVINFWTSDFDSGSGTGCFGCGPTATTATITVTANGDGSDTWNIVAYY